MSSRPRRRFFKTTGFRLTLWYSLVFIVSAGVLFWLAHFLVSSTIEEIDGRLVRARISDYTRQARTGGLEGLLKKVRQDDRGNRRAGLFVRVADPDNRTLWSTLPPQWHQGDLRRIERMSTGPRGHGPGFKIKNEEDVLDVTGRRLSGGYLLQVGKSSEEREEVLERFRSIFAEIMVALILLGVTGGSFLAFRALRPIRDLITTIRHVDTGRMDSRVPPARTGDELDELIRLFNGMLARIELLISGMRGALDNVAHDLKTPVTRLRAVIETALDSASDASALREALMDCAEESERIVTMLDILMDISEAETGTMSLNLEKVDVMAVIDDVIDLYQYVAEDKKIEISSQVSPGLDVTADPGRLRQVLANLLDNALKYSGEGGRVGLRAVSAGKEVMIEVSDNGPGIPSHDLSRIFERLYRGDQSRSQKGLGLGLSLVQAVVRAHHGRIEVQSRPGEGSRFTVYLPARSGDES
jgi:signal transduction histidine kinase